MEATDIPELCRERGWTRMRLISELRQAAKGQKWELPGDQSMQRMVRDWANGRRQLSEDYAGLFTAVFGIPFSSVGRPATAEADERQEDLGARLDAAATVDSQLVEILEGQTQTLRDLDRRLGARLVLPQTELHLTQVSELFSYCLTSDLRGSLAEAAAEVAALAGWQALDLGEPSASWKHHETAKSLARESSSAAVQAHVAAQQANALLDLGRTDEAVRIVHQARRSAGTAVPELLRCWLNAAEAEAHAAAGNAAAAYKALERADRLHPEQGDDPSLPFIFLGTSHLRRWRGHCLARLGETEALDELHGGLAALDPSFTRAAAGLRCDLALTHSVRGEHEQAWTEAQVAEKLAASVASQRQRRRIRELKDDSARKVR